MSGFCRAVRWLLLSLTLCLAAAAAQAQRVALVLANADYAVGRLTNPLVDAQLMEAALKALGFKVVTLLDGSQNQMRRAIRDFAADAKGAEVALVYYSGHAVQASGENFLIPLKATIESEADYEVEAVSVNHLLRQLELARPAASIIVLDACRDNPLASLTKSTTKGMARMDAPGGTMIAFATAPNTTAADNGLYARALSAELRKPGQEIVDVFRNTTDEVRRLSNGKQVPRVSEVSLYGRLYLAGEPQAAPEAAAGQSRNHAEYALAVDGVGVLRRKLQTTTIDNLQRQADRGDAEAQYLVAVAKMNGLGLPEDLRGARQYMRLSAKAGFLRATMAYGNILFDGLGGSANPDEAVDWWLDGAKADFAPSLRRLSEYQRMRTDKARDLKAGYDYAQRANALGHPDAPAEMGVYHASGLGMPVDKAKAVQLYAASAAKGSTFGMSQLAWAHRYGVGVQADKARALKLYVQAGDLGRAAAFKNAGDMLDGGELDASRANEAGPVYLKGAALGDMGALDKALAMVLARRLAKPADWNLEQQINRALEAGFPDSSVQLVAGLGKGSEVVAKDELKAARLARAVMARMLAAAVDSELAYPRYAYDMAHVVIDALKAGHLTPSPASELATLQAQWGDTKKFTLYPSKINCDGVQAVFNLYIWHSREGPEPVKRQIDWLRAARGCDVPADVADAFTAFFKIAKEGKKDYREVVANALADDSKKTK